MMTSSDITGVEALQWAFIKSIFEVNSIFLAHIIVQSTTGFDYTITKFKTDIQWSVK
jgi:hypothetical protein